MTQSLTWRLGEHFPPKNPPNLYENTVICDNLWTFSLNAKKSPKRPNYGLFGDSNALFKNFSRFSNMAYLCGILKVLNIEEPSQI